MNREELKKIIPHREPMLLLDEAWEEDGVAFGTYTVRGDEFFLQGHYPGNPVVPGVILCEMMAQTSCMLSSIQCEGKTPYFTGIDGVRFKQKVLPGDKVVFKTRLDISKPPFFFIKSEGYVNDKLCVKGELSFAVM